ncbi:hypothetical protein [Persicitalea sp.]|uniref:hypothetical protein n=1 Tax=Persicitalea sp. TaxID=3100273 RepID=UPI0035935EAB
MENVSSPLLNKKQILTATLVALVLGAFLFVAAVLPAEYGSDPLGTGRLLGFSGLHQADGPSEIPTVEASAVVFPILKKEDLGSEPDVPMPKEANNPPPVQQYAERQDSVSVRVPAGNGIEYKVKVLKYGALKYEWVTDQGVLYSDFHGEVKEATPPKEEFFLSYTIAYSNNLIGTFLAPYEGRHGWYFRNKTDNDIVVSLRLSGQYELE